MHVDPVLAAVGPGHAGLEVEVGTGVERVRRQRAHALAIVRVQLREQRFQVPARHGRGVAEAAVVQLGVPALAGDDVDLPFAHVRRRQRELQPRLALAQRGVDLLLLGDVGRNRQHRLHAAVVCELGDQARRERPRLAADAQVLELEALHLAGGEGLAHGAFPVGLHLGGHARLEARAADMLGRRKAAVALDDRAHVEVAQVAVQAREDVGRVLHQRGELALAPGQRRRGPGQRRLRLHAVVDVADHRQRAKRLLRRVLQHGEEGFDVHLPAVGAHVHRLRAAVAVRAQLLARAQGARRVRPALAEQVAARPTQRLGGGAGVQPLGRRVHEDHVVVDVERQHRVLHLGQHVLAQRVAGGVRAVEGIDVLADDQGVDVAAADGGERVLGLGEPRLEFEVGPAQARQLVGLHAGSGEFGAHRAFPSSGFSASRGRPVP